MQCNIWWGPSNQTFQDHYQWSTYC